MDARTQHETYRSLSTLLECILLENFFFANTVSSQFLFTITRQVEIWNQRSYHIQVGYKKKAKKRHIVFTLIFLALNNRSFWRYIFTDKQKHQWNDES